MARYAYLWDDKVSKPAVPVSFPAGKTGVTMSEKDGGVLIEFDKFTVFIRQK